MLSLKDYYTGELNSTKESYKNDLDMKNKENSKLQEVILKIQNELELAKKELSQKDIEIETLEIKLDDKNNIVKQEKEGLLKQIQELHIKADIERNALNSRLKDQTQKIEELSKELNQIKSQTNYSSNNEFSLESIL